MIARRRNREIRHNFHGLSFQFNMSKKCSGLRNDLKFHRLWNTDVKFYWNYMNVVSKSQKKKISFYYYYSRQPIWLWIQHFEAICKILSVISGSITNYSKAWFETTPIYYFSVSWKCCFVFCFIDIYWDTGVVDIQNNSICGWLWLEAQQKLSAGSLGCP